MTLAAFRTAATAVAVAAAAFLATESAARFLVDPIAPTWVVATDLAACLVASLSAIAITVVLRDVGSLLAPAVALLDVITRMLGTSDGAAVVIADATRVLAPLCVMSIACVSGRRSAGVQRLGALVLGCVALAWIVSSVTPFGLVVASVTHAAALLMLTAATARPALRPVIRQARTLWESADVR